MRWRWILVCWVASLTSVILVREVGGAFRAGGIVLHGLRWDGLLHHAVGGATIGAEDKFDAAALEALEVERATEAVFIEAFPSRA